MADRMLDLIKSRRVVRSMTDQPVPRERLEQILEAGRWAPVGGNRRIHRFVVIDDVPTLRLLRMVSPGMFQHPAAVILLCIDWNEVAANEFSASDRTPYIDLGTTMQTMMLAAHALGLGTGPVTSFAKEAVRVVLNLPPNLSPDLMVCVGYAAGSGQLPMRGEKVTWRRLTHWGSYLEPQVAGEGRPGND